MHPDAENDALLDDDDDEPLSSTPEAISPLWKMTLALEQLIQDRRPRRRREFD